MYVIFPADEVVYLSYGRLIYIPTVAAHHLEEHQQHLQQQRQQRQQPLPLTPSQLHHIHLQQHLNNIDNNHPTLTTLTNCTLSFNPSSEPNPSTSSLSPSASIRRASSTKSASPLLLLNDSPIRPERNKVLKDKNKANGNIKTTSTNSSLSISTGNKLKSSPTSISLQASQKSSEQAKHNRDKRLSYSDFLPVHKCLKPEQSLNPTVPKSPKKAVNFDDLFERREASPLKLSPSSEVYESRLQRLQQSPSPDKSPTKKKTFFLNKSPKPEPRLQRTSDFGISVQKRQQQQQQQLLQQYQPNDVTNSTNGWSWGWENMAAAVETSTLKELTHPTYNELLKGHNAVTFKLIRTVSDFTQQLSQMYEQHAAELQHLVANFRKRNGELRKERPACASSVFHTWETLLQEVEIDSQALGDIASILGRQVSRPLLEKSFYRKIQSRKVFTHRESYETIIAKTEEKLVKCRQEYKNAYVLYLSAPSTETLSGYFNTHNAYVQQLHATNGMLDAYGKETLPQLLQELEEIYTDLCSTLSESVTQGAEVVAARAMEQNRRYEGLITQCKNVNGNMDLVHLSRALPVPQGRAPVTRRLFVPPQPPPQQEVEGEDGPTISNENIPPPLKDELVIDRLSAVQVKPSHDALRKEAGDLDIQIRQIHDALETLVRLQQRSVEASLFNKANEIQEDISMKRFDLRVAQLHLSAINAQKELFSNKLDNASGTGGDSGRERKMSNVSQGSMKTKWLKAFKSLKTPPPEADKKNGSAATRELLKGDPDAHNFQEYTYKKITPCDVCSQVLRGHTKQGLKCRICKINIHHDCQEKASKCTAKARLLRRQKSTSEIETKTIEPTTVEEEKASEVDLIYQVLKQAGEISSSKTPPPQIQQQQQPQPTMPQQTAMQPTALGITLERGATPSSSGQNLNRSGIRPPTISQQQPPTQGTNLCVINPAPCSTSSAPHSPRRQKLNLRMKSLSLDSPESTEHVQRRKHHGAATTSDPHSNQGSSSRIQSPSSPVHNRRLLSAKNIRMSSVELPDDNEKSPSSASTSPCPSPVGGKHKPHRLLPTNLYVVLYNFKSRHQDELDLKAGYKVTVIDTSDPDWWKGKCLGRVGYFPSKYCSKLSPGEKPLQVTHNLQVSDGDNGLMLLRDQIVIQIGEELDGMVMIRSGDNRQGVCPVKFLQEV